MNRTKRTLRQCDVNALLQQHPLLFYMCEQKLVRTNISQSCGHCTHHLIGCTGSHTKPPFPHSELKYISKLIEL